MNHVHYEVIEKALNHIEWPTTFKSLVEQLHQSLSLDTQDIEKILVVMEEEGTLLEYKELFYWLDDVHFAVGSFRVVREQFAFVETGEEGIYVGSGDFGGAMDMDTVLVEIKKNGRTHGVVLGVISRNREYILGTLEKEDKKIKFVPYDRKVLLPINYVDRKDLKIGDRVIGKIINIGKEIDVEIVSILGQADEPGMDVLSVLYVYGIDVDFPEDVLAEANRVPETISEKELKGRVDHRDQYVITIDGEDAKDLDDAIYMESLANGYRLYVHIADVSHYVPMHSKLDKEAYKRSSSVYMVDRVVPMLPKVLSNGICSLHPHVDRLTLTCQMDIGFDGELLDYHVYPSVINSKRRYSYNEVNDGKDLGEATDMIDMMFDCMHGINKRRTQKGSIDFDSDESKFIVDHEGKVLDIFRRERGEAEMMIEAFMISANESLARLTKYLEIPSLYRVHEEPDKEKLQEVSHTLRILGYRMRGSLDKVRPKLLQQALNHFQDKPEYPIVSRLVLRSMSKARYSQDPIGHFGLALEDYTHFTSPIRRYPDLLLHQRIRTYLFDKDFKHLEEDEKFAVEASVHVSKKEKSILDAERQVEKIKKCEYMSHKIGEQYEGFVSGITNFGMFVELPNTVEGLIPLKDLKDDYYTFDASSQKLIGQRTGKEYTIGEKVKVKVSGVDMVENTVQLALIGAKKGGRKHVRRRKKPKSRS